MNKAQKQNKIDKFLQSFVKMSAFEENAEIKLAINICETLDSVFDNHYFLPRYYSISNLLNDYKETDNDLYDRSSSLRELLKKSKDFLNQLKPDNDLCNQYDALLRYCFDEVFKHSVDEFYSSALHEIIIYEASSSGRRNNQNVEQVNSITETIKDLNEQIQKIELNSQRIDIKLQQANDTLPNMLTAMGIFVAIIIAIVAIYLTTIINNHPINIVRTFFLVDSIQARISILLFLGLFAFDLLFVFLYLIAKITDRSIACNCYGCEGNVCQPKKCNFFMRIIKRYWNFIVVNTITIIAIFLLFVWHNTTLTKEEKNKLIHDTDIFITECPQTTETDSPE